MIYSDRERQAPTKISDTEPTHLARYEFLDSFLKETDIVLDVPCGSGYGTNIISRKVKRVIGIDISKEAIRHAEEFFQLKNIDFIVDNMENLKNGLLKNIKFDVIVSFEGIEHIEKQDLFLNFISEKLKKNGCLIISTPRKPHGSPFHKVEHTLESFEKLLSKRFIIEKMFGQIYTDIFDMNKKFENPNNYNKFNFIAVCKNR